MLQQKFYPSFPTSAPPDGFRHESGIKAAATAVTSFSILTPFQNHFYRQIISVTFSF